MISPRNRGGQARVSKASCKPQPVPWSLTGRAGLERSPRWQADGRPMSRKMPGMRRSSAVTRAAERPGGPGADRRARMPFARSFLQAASRPDLGASRGIALTDFEERGPTGCCPGQPGGSHHPAGPHAGCCAPVTTPPRTSGHVPPAPRAAAAQGSAGRDWCLWSAVGSGSATWLLAGSEEPLSRGGGTSDPARPSWVT